MTDEESRALLAIVKTVKITAGLIVGIALATAIWVGGQTWVVRLIQVNSQLAAENKQLKDAATKEVP